MAWGGWLAAASGALRGAGGHVHGRGCCKPTHGCGRGRRRVFWPEHKVGKGDKAVMVPA